MSEWVVVEVIIALVGLIAVMVRPMINLTKAITELTVTVKSLQGEFAEFKTNTHESHREIWNHIRKQDDQIEDHERRLQIIENRKDE